MSITRWDPFRDLVALQERMNRLFDESIRARTTDEEIVPGAWVPTVDVYETGEALVVKAYLPEVKREDIEVRVESGVLLIRGERKIQEEFSKDNCYRMESQYGSFSRSFNLPPDIDPDRVDASLKDGVLRVRIPRREDTKKLHRIEIG